MKKITINGKEYVIKKIDFKAFCELDDLGFDVKQAQEKTFKSIRALIAFIANCTLDEACEIAELHIKNGGKIDDFAPLFTMISESDFFRNISQ